MPSHPRPRTLAGLAAVGLAAVALSSCGPKGQQAQAGPGDQAAPVGVVVAAAEPVDVKTELTGRTAPSLIAEVRPQVGGIVQARLFQEGGYVTAGQPLYQIDPAVYRAALASANAGLAQAQAGYNAARLKADRYKKLVDLQAVSQQDNDEAQAASAQGAANVAAQKAAVDQARINLGYTRVTAPISGRIGKSSVTAGALLTPGQVQPLATVQKLDVINVDITQSTAELLRMRSGGAAALGKAPAEVKLILEDGSTYARSGRLEFSDLTVDPSTGSVGLRAIFPNPDGVLLPGMYVRAVVSGGGGQTGILVPQAAVSRDAKGQASVLVVGAKGAAEPRPITVGQTVGARWLVTSGLQPGDKIIVEGLQKVRPGAPVRASIVVASR